ncbi:MAG: [FeFe] hydrogenase H-cluster maturation GTPase HydF [Lachnospiraceae bacterium]|nr:[FeFe] hydrogenase H-cluster maturation GTPase HydF [Lachnospiraceae bacterium]
MQRGGAVNSMNQTPVSERVHITFFGRRNAGKSSLMNAFTGQEISIVSPVMGTTTDVVYKTMELPPLGPVVLVDTPGLDDTGTLGGQRIARAKEAMRKTDIAIVVTDAVLPPDEIEKDMLAEFDKKKIPCLLVFNKADLLKEIPAEDEKTLLVSAKTGFHIRELKERVAAMLPEETKERPLIADLIAKKDTVVLVVPIDAGAPKGRLILPQQQVIRDVLEAGACGLVCRHTELEETLEKLKTPPALVITDSQVFDQVEKIVPDFVPLTSFSILMARYKGDLPLLTEGAAAIEKLRGGDKVLICEGCTHHRQCGDIGTVKLPNLIRRYTKAEPSFSFTSGTEFPTDVSSYKMVVHCGGCMLNRKEMQYRLMCCREAGVPVTNYGVLIACINGILERTLEIFKNGQKTDVKLD